MMNCIRQQNSDTPYLLLLHLLVASCFRETLAFSCSLHPAIMISTAPDNTATLLTASYYRPRQTTSIFSSFESNDSSNPEDESILCDLQTLLKLTGVLSTGGSAKVMIQNGEVQLNGSIEKRRAKKLYPGDVVTFQGIRTNVSEVIRDKDYQYKPKVKKLKPKPTVDEFGRLEFGGRYRSEEWRAERKQKKVKKKKVQHHKGKDGILTGDGRRKQGTAEEVATNQANQIQEFLQEKK